MSHFVNKKMVGMILLSRHMVADGAGSGDGAVYY